MLIFGITYKADLKMIRRLESIAKRMHFERTYSQLFEDRLISTLANWFGIEIKTYLDIGSHHPINGNNTAFFYFSGARGVAVDVNPKFGDLFSKFRLEDKFINAAVGAGECTMPFYHIDPDVLSTLSKEHADNCVEQGHAIVETVDVPVISLANIIDEYFVEMAPDLMCIDVEGVEEDVLKSNNWEKKRPSIICIESIEYGRNKPGKRVQGPIGLLESEGYHKIADTYLNAIYFDNNKI